MSRTRYAPDFVDDLEAIHGFIEEEAGEEQALRVTAGLMECVKRLAKFPHMGVIRGRLGWRMFREGQLLIYYRETGEGIELLRVVHSKRDQRRALGQTGE